MNNTFANAISNQIARTENGMKARKSTANACVDFFYNVGASRGKNIIPNFVAAYVENREVALRIAQWARDARGGAGERQVFKDILVYLATNKPADAVRLVLKTPEIGRWDDLLSVFTFGTVGEYALQVVKNALDAQNGLCAKWMPRKGPEAEMLRNFLGYSPKRYRKTLVTLTKAVEQQMCAGDWDNINFSHVPSLAAARYQKAFGLHTPKYAEYKAALATGDAKINASVVYPYDVIHSVYRGDKDVALAQWEAMPNFVGDANILPMVDVSGSMSCRAGGIRSKSEITCMDVAISLGIYLADKNTGKFKDMFLTFSGNSELVQLHGNLLQKIDQLSRADWGMNTDLHRAFSKVLEVAVNGNVPQDEMPEIVLIMSDMQFDQCVRWDDSAIEMIARKYEAAGYKMPKVVFWNLNASYGNVPVAANARDIALVSGFSPAIMKSVLAAEDFSPEAIMLKTVMVPRYDL